MPRSGGQKTKLLLLLDILTHETDEDHPLSVPRLVERLEAKGVKAERKSIYSDIEELQGLGYSIGRQCGPGGGYFLEEGLFELPELKLLVDAVQSSKFINETNSRKLIKKLTQLTSRYQAEELNRQVLLTGRAKTPKNTQYVLDALHRAIRDKSKVSFVYNEWNVEKQLCPRRERRYEFSPITLCYVNEQYYLVAYKPEHGGLTHFRVDKISDLRQLEETAETYPRLQVNEYVRRNFNMYSGPESPVTLSAPASLAGVMVDRFGTDPLFVKEGERFHFTVPVSVSEQFFGWVCGFAGAVKILAPEAVREEYQSYLKKLQDNI